ncbi:MAG: YciI family protein [Nannocystaceae bacterium]|nr:YciI family protein [Nannocystaceae bacterium]
MQYLALIYANEADQDNNTPEQGKEIFAKYMAFNEEAKAAGVFVAGDALMPTSTATTVRMRDGKLLTTDGPFAETKEQLGGYYMLECKDLDEAIRWAAKIPTSVHGSIEVRPLLVF